MTPRGNGQPWPGAWNALMRARLGEFLQGVLEIAKHSMASEAFGCRQRALSGIYFITAIKISRFWEIFFKPA